MPKIRGIKPDYWTNEDIVDLTIPARLLFIGLWNYACDNGHLPDKPKQIKMRLFPGDDVNVAELLRELDDKGRIDRVNGWVIIPKFAHHQKPNKRFWLTCEMPECGKPKADSQPETPSGKGEPSLRKGGKGGASADGEVEVDCEVDGDGEGEVAITSADAEIEFNEFWIRYPRKVAKGAARKAWKTALKKVDNPAELVDACRRFSVRVHGSDEKFIPHASTWLNAERWLDETDAVLSGAEPHRRDQPFRPPDCPPEIAEDGTRYVEWLREERAKWDAAQAASR